MEAMEKIIKALSYIPHKIAKVARKKKTKRTGRRNQARATGGDLYQVQGAPEDLQHGSRDHPVDIYRFLGNLHHYSRDLRQLGDMIRYPGDWYCYPGDFNRCSSDSDIINVIVDL